MKKKNKIQNSKVKGGLTCHDTSRAFSQARATEIFKLAQFSVVSATFEYFKSTFKII